MEKTFDKTLLNINQTLKQYGSFQPANFYTHKTSYPFKLVFTGKTLVVYWLKHGHMWMTSQGFEGGMVSSNIYSDGSFTLDKVDNEHNKGSEFVDDLLSNKYPVVVLSRDPVNYVLSGLSQAFLYQVNAKAFGSAYKEFDQDSYNTLDIIEKDKWFLEGYLTNHSINNYNEYINSHIRRYIKFVIENYEHVLLMDPHIKARVSNNYRYLFSHLDLNNVSIVDIDEIDKRDELVDFLHDKGLLTQKRNIDPNSKVRHSTKALKRLIRQVLKELELPQGLSIYLRIENEVDDYVKFKNQYRDLWV